MAVDPIIRVGYQKVWVEGLMDENITRGQGGNQSWVVGGMGFMALGCFKAYASSVHNGADLKFHNDQSVCGTSPSAWRVLALEKVDGLTTSRPVTFRNSNYIRHTMTKGATGA